MSRYVVVTPPASEPITIAEAKAFARLDGVNAEPAPGAITAALASPAAPGNVENGAHRYLATFVTASGETQAGVASSAVTVADKTINGQVRLTAIPTGSSQVTSRKIYRTTAGGSTYLLLATLADNTTTTYTDNTADASLGAGAPSTNTTDDPLLVMFLATARQAAEKELNRYLITQTVDAYFDGFPGACYDGHGNDEAIYLPPMQSVVSVSYVDSAGDTQVIDPVDYVVDVASKPGRVMPAYGTTWPTAIDQPNAVTVRFIAGYGAAAAVPACVKQWIALQVKAYWDNRDAYTMQAGLTQAAALPSTFTGGLLEPEKVQGFLA